MAIDWTGKLRPDDLAHRSGSDLGALWKHFPKLKAGRLTEAQLRQLLGLETRDALDGFWRPRRCG
jgi:hypothetical protein